MEENISPLWLLREYGKKDPEPLTAEEKIRIKEILDISTQSSLNQNTPVLYEEYKKLITKEKGNCTMETMLEIIEHYLGKRSAYLFKQYKDSIPGESEGDQYAVWTRPALNSSSRKELYAYFMHVILSQFGKVDFPLICPEEMKKGIAEYAQAHVLQAADMMMAKAGDISREITYEQTLLLFERLLYFVQEIN